MSALEYDFKDFVTYLMIYAAYSDLELTGDEKKFIIKKVGQHRYDKMDTLFQSQNDKEVIDFILKMKKIHVDKDGSKDMLQILKDVFFADGEFSTLEQNVYLSLKRFE